MDHFDSISLVASTPGRLRLEIPDLYRAQPLADRLLSEARTHPAIDEAHASVLTARVLLLFDPKLDGQALLAELGLSLHRAGAPHRHAVEAPGGKSEAPVPAMYAPWHLRSREEALAHHGSSLARGLTQAQARRRLRDGANTIPLPRRASALHILANQFKTMPVILLAVSAGLSVLTGALAEAAAIGAVLVLNAAIGFVTEKQAEATIASLSELINDSVLVLRDGQVQPIDASCVVPGDILVLNPGARVAADVRLLQANGLTIDESPLTGESLPVAKDVDAQVRPTPLAERSNMAYRGTAVATGTGLGLVVGTGCHTEAGAIEMLTRATERPKTLTQVQLDQLGAGLVKLSSAMCLGVFGLGLLRGYDRLGISKTAVALAIAAVPEGLPAVATTSLARGIRRMREQHVLVRHLHAVDTLGAIQTICLDKTGTLTMNQMSVTAVQSVRHAIGAQATAVGCGKVPTSELARLVQVCVLCNETHANGTLHASGTETALMQFAERCGAQVDVLRQQFPLLSAELRGEGRNYMRTVHAVAGSRQRLYAVKGSPQEVLALCDGYLDGDAVRALDGATRARIAQQNQDMAARQLRVLGIAYAEQADRDAPMPALAWVALVGMSDPLRPGVEQVMERFHEAGIRTVMLTGDQAGTAYEIGRALHLNNGAELNVVDSDELSRVAADQLPALAARADIFARVTPSDKLRIVEALQASGLTVAMTGDGINDSPALRAADIGIAMGSGTDVALSVADVALQYDQLHDVLDAVRQGRTIAANTRKSVHFLVSSNLSEILVVAGGFAVGNSHPLSPFQLLWLNLLTDLLPAIALAAEPAEEDVMRGAPHRRTRELIEKEDMWRYGREAGVLAGGVLSAYALGALRHGPGARANTIGFDSLVLGQLLHALHCRFERRSVLAPGAPPNRQLALSLAASLGLQGLAHLLPGLRRLLGLSPLGLLDWLTVLAGAGVPLLVNALARPGTIQNKAATSASAERSTSLSTTAPTTLSATEPLDPVRRAG